MTQIGHIDGITKRRNHWFALAVSLCLLGHANSASAQEKAALPTAPGLNLSVASPSLNYDQLELVGLSSSIEGAIIDLPSEALAAGLLDFGASDVTCIAGKAGCLRHDETLDVVYETSFTKNNSSGLDISLTPRASMRFDDESSSAIVGALVKIGDDLREEPDVKANTWYMFAGADAEAVTYAPGSVTRLTQGDFHLQDKIIVGDSQAGFGYKIGDADVSLGYFRREVKSFGREVNSGGISYTEDAAALSFTWRR